MIPRHSMGHPCSVAERNDRLERLWYESFVRSGKPILVIDDLVKWPCGEIAKAAGSSFTVLSCPVMRRTGPFGVLSVYCRAPLPPGNQHGGLLGALARLIEICEDSRALAHQVEEKHEFAQLLEESTALNEQMVQLSPVAIYRIDLVNQKFISVNDYMCQATGYAREELLKMPPMDLLTSESRELFLQRCEAMADGHALSGDLELQVVTKGGAVEWTRFHIRHFFDNGKPAGANVVAHFITQEKNSLEELRRYRQQLEDLVQERTAALAKVNQELRKEIDQRTLASEKLVASGVRLKEMNTAMRVLLDKRTEDQERAEELIRLNLKELIDPYLERLGNSGLRERQKQLLEVIRMNLDDVVGSSLPEFSDKYYLFSPNELQVVNLIRKGKTSKEMAGLLNLSVRTIESYRKSIRGKLNLRNKKINLKIYLNSI